MGLHTLDRPQYHHCRSRVSVDKSGGGMTASLASDHWYWHLPSTSINHNQYHHLIQTCLYNHYNTPHMIKTWPLETNIACLLPMHNFLSSLSAFNLLMWASTFISSLGICRLWSSRIWVHCFFTKNPWLQRQHSSLYKSMMLAIVASDHLPLIGTSTNVVATMFFSFNFGATISWQWNAIAKDVHPMKVGLSFVILLRFSYILNARIITYSLWPLLLQIQRTTMHKLYLSVTKT